MANGAEAFDEAFDEGFDEGFDEAFDEARFRPRRVVTAAPTPLPPRPADRPVTQSQLQLAVNKLNGDISRNSAAIQKVNGNLALLGRDVRRQRTAAASNRRDIGTLKDALVLLPLLSSTIGTSNPMLTALFPMLLLSGVGESGTGSSSSGSGMLGGDQTTTLLLILAMTGGLGSKA